jgi:hypothetical protein
MTTTQTKNVKPQDLFNVDGAAERWTEASRKVGNEYLDLYEKTANQFADLEVKTAQAIKIPAFITFAETHASASREVAGAYVSAVRDLLKS